MTTIQNWLDCLFCMPMTSSYSSMQSCIQIACPQWLLLETLKGLKCILELIYEAPWQCSCEYCERAWLRNSKVSFTKKTFLASAKAAYTHAAAINACKRANDLSLTGQTRSTGKLQPQRELAAARYCCKETANQPILQYHACKRVPCMLHRNLEMSI